MRSEEQIRNMYRSYIELWASSEATNRPDRDILHGAILAYGRVLGFDAQKINKDMVLAKDKYAKTIYH